MGFYDITPTEEPTTTSPAAGGNFYDSGPSTPATPAPSTPPASGGFFSGIGNFLSGVGDKIENALGFGTPKVSTTGGGSDVLNATLLTGPTPDMINQQAKDLTTQKANLDLSDPAAIDNFNTSVDTYNRNLQQGILAQGAKNVLDKNVIPVEQQTPFQQLSHDLSQVLNEPIHLAGDYLGNTKVFQDLAKGSDEGQFLPSFTEELANRLQFGTGVISGATGGIIQPEYTGAPQDFSAKLLYSLSSGLGAISSIGGIEKGLFSGLSAPEVITSNLTNYPKVAEYFNSLAKVAPAFATYGQLNPNLTNAGDRIKTLGTDILASVPLTALGLFGPKTTVPVSAALGFGLAKLSGASNKDATVSATTFGLLSMLGIPKGETSTDLITQKDAQGKLYNEAIATINKYSDIKLSDNPTTDEIKKAYKSAAMNTHPDRGGDAKDFSSATYAKDILLGENKSTEAKMTNQKTPEEMQKDVNETVANFRQKGEVAPIETSPEAVVAAKGPLVTTPDLRTFDFSEKEGEPQTDAENAKIHNQIINNPDQPMTPGGESFNQAIKREQGIVNEIKNSPEVKNGENVGIVTHNSMYGLIKLQAENGWPAVIDKQLRDAYTKQDNSSPTGDSYVIKGKNGDGDIVLMRHGETEDNAKKLFRRAEAKLTDKGKQQALDLSDEVKKFNLAKIYSSDLPRAVQTSNIVLHGEKGLDINNNKLENKQYDNLRTGQGIVRENRKGEEDISTTSEKRLGSNQNGEILRERLANNYREDGKLNKLSAGSIESIAKGDRVKIDEKTPEILRAIGFSEPLIDIFNEAV